MLLTGGRLHALMELVALSTRLASHTIPNNNWQWLAKRHARGKGMKQRYQRKVPRPTYPATDSDLLPVVALVGRPNVGKSALYNRLLKKREALVWGTPHSHVTRDYRQGMGRLGDLHFHVVDTSGLEPFSSEGSIQYRATALTTRVLNSADFIFFMLDGREGVLAADEALGQWLRSHLGPEGIGRIHVLINKCERKGRMQLAGVGQAIDDARRMGLGEPVAMSASSGEGLVDLYEKLQPFIDNFRASRQEQQLQDQEECAEEGAVGTNAEVEQEECAEEAAVGTDAEVEQEEVRELSPVDRFAVHHPRNMQEAQRQEQHLEEQFARVMASEQEDRMWTPRAEERLEMLEKRAEATAKILRKDILRMAIMGLPNVGKSTLTNLLLGEERVMTGPEPGLTRDPVSVPFNYDGRPFMLVDTPGWMKKNRLENYDESEGKVAAQALAAGAKELQYAQVVVMLMDAQQLWNNHQARVNNTLFRQELSLAALAAQEGRALVLAINKMDLLQVEDAKKVLQLVRQALTRQLPQVCNLPCLGLSVLRQKGVQRLLATVQDVWDSWNTRVPTAELNKWLRKQVSKHTGSSTATQLGRIRYVTQVSIRPPCIAVFFKGKDPPGAAFAKFLKNSIVEEFKFEGTPLRISIRIKGGGKLRV